MSSDSESSVSGGEGSEYEYSDDEDYVSPPPRSRKNSDQPSSSAVPPKKRRVKSPAKEESNEWGKPDLTQLCLGGLALFNMENEMGSTKQIRDFIMEQFPYYKNVSLKYWRNYFVTIQKRVGLTIAGKTEGQYQYNIVRLNSSTCASLKKQLENKLATKMDSIKLTMADPGNLDLFLQKIRDYICITDQSTELRPKVGVRKLVQEVFEENFEIEMTVPEITTKIVEKYEYYADQDRKRTMVARTYGILRSTVVFMTCGQREKRNLWKLNVS